MGRVYNALLKAERWKDRDRPIGRPAGVPRDWSADLSGHQAVYLRSQPEPSVSSDVNGHSSEPVFDDVPREFDFNDPVVLSETMSASQRRPALGQHALHVAAPSQQAPAFVEPRTVVNAGSLNIEPHLAALHGEDRLACERYRTLAVRLLNFGVRRKFKTVLVTSSEEGEGKSTVAANLAWSLAKPTERRVLFLDASASGSSLNRLHGLSTGRGWIDLAAQRCQFADAAVRLNPNGLYVLPSGSAETDSPAVSDALTSSSFEKLIAGLERDFDFIIIDSPPILESAGAQRLASLVDGVVFVVRAAHTHHNAVTDGIQLVPPDRRLGLVLNESDFDDTIIQRRNKKSKGRVLKRSA